jgi:hypothetical protein
MPLIGRLWLSTMREVVVNERKGRLLLSAKLFTHEPDLER